MFLFRLLLILLSFSLPLLAKYELAVCMIFQNEAHWLKEWIEFHKLQGAEHFYLYNNLSTDNFRKVLKPYIDSGEVTLINWPYTYPIGNQNEWNLVQDAAYDHCIIKNRNACNWLAILDSDEFLFSPTGLSLPEILMDYKHFSGVCVNWVVFGTSGVQQIPQRCLMIDLLTLCEDLTKHKNEWIVKSIVQPKFVQSVRNPHRCAFTQGFDVAVDKEPLQALPNQRIHSSNLLIDKLRINHYWARTEQYFLKRKLERYRVTGRNEERRKTIQDAKRLNHSEDTAIQIYSEQLKVAMGFLDD